MSRVVDFHTHILPGIDDGSASLEESMELLRSETAQGIQRIVATPHFYAQSDSPERFLARREASDCRLRETMAEQPGMPEIILGAEVYFFSGMSDCDALPALTIGEKGYLLLEMPPSPWTNRMYRELEEIRAKRDIVPVIAHVDRYMGLLNTHGIPQQLERLPVLVQANAGFFLRRSTQARALRMLEKNQIHLLGSDCHNMTSRPPRLIDAIQTIERYLPPKTIDRICYYQKQVLD